jgi:hypothetical protein
MELQVDDPDEARQQLSLAFVEVRSTPDDPRHWYVRPADAHGLLVEVGPGEP